MSKFYAFFAAIPALLVIALHVGIVIGLAGSLIEEIGKFFKLPRIVAFGKQLEAVGVDVPKWVGEFQTYFSKLPKLPLAAFVVLFAVGLNAGTLVGCSSLPSAASVSQVPKDVAIAYSAAGAALAVADTVEAAWLDGLPNPTADQLATAQAVVDKLQKVKAALDAVKADMAAGKDKLRGALADLADASALLQLSGVRVPDAIAKALAAASEAVK